MSEIAGIDPSVPPSGEGCVECEAAGGWWVHLRRCAQCGHIGCCDTSPMQHATAHASATGHPFIRSFEPGEDWFYSYETKETYEGPELAPPQHHPVDQGVPGPKGRVPSGLAPARALLVPRQVTFAHDDDIAVVRPGPFKIKTSRMALPREHECCGTPGSA